MGIKYSVVERGDIEELEDAVNERLNEGWELQGGVSVAISAYVGKVPAEYKDDPDYPEKIGGEEKYCQAMTKRS